MIKFCHADNGLRTKHMHTHMYTYTVFSDVLTKISIIHRDLCYYQLWSVTLIQFLLLLGDRSLSFCLFRILFQTRKSSAKLSQADSSVSLKSAWVYFSIWSWSAGNCNMFACVYVFCFVTIFLDYVIAITIVCLSRPIQLNFYLLHNATDLLYECCVFFVLRAWSLQNCNKIVYFYSAISSASAWLSCYLAVFVGWFISFGSGLVVNVLEQRQSLT